MRYEGNLSLHEIVFHCPTCLKEVRVTATFRELTLEDLRRADNGLDAETRAAIDDTP